MNEIMKKIAQISVRFLTRLRSKFGVPVVAGCHALRGSIIRQEMEGHRAQL
jgi:N-formylglutamate amidohydrolase